MTLATKIPLLAAALLLAGCTHTMGVVRRYEEERVVPGTAVAHPEAERTVAIAVDEDVVGADGVLRGRVRLTAPGTHELEIDVHHVRAESWFRPLGTTLRRAFITPFYLALLGPFWAPVIPDYGDDGRVGAIDRLWFTVAMLNPLSALPTDRDRRTLDRVVDTRRARDEATVDLGVPETDLQLHLSSERATRVLSATPDAEGELAFDLSPVLADVFDRGLGAEIVERLSGTRVPVPSFGRLAAAELLWARGLLAPGSDALDAEQRAVAADAFRDAGAGSLADRPRAVAFFRRAFELAGPPAVPEPERGDALDLEDAVDRGLVVARGSGRGIDTVSLRVTNVSDRELAVRVRPGTYLLCGGDAQDMVTTEERRETLVPGGSASLGIGAACANMDLPTPTGVHDFQVRTAEVADDLARVTPWLARAKYTTRQAAVWIVTDDATPAKFGRYSTPAIRTREILEAVALLELSGVDLSRYAVHAWYGG